MYEPKYDGVRVKVMISSGKEESAVQLWSRRGNALTAQFPDLVHELRRLGNALDAPVLLDGEIVAIDGRGKPLGYQALQGRIGLAKPTTADVRLGPVALMLFDLLLHDGDDLRSRPYFERRQRLERIFSRATSPSTLLRVGRMEREHGQALYDEAVREGWEGIMAKRAASPYRSGRHHADWRKLKLLLQQEFVVGGWTESESRPFRALLLGVYTEETQLDYVGRMGKVFSDRDLRDLSSRLRRLETEICPFREEPAPDARPHWVKPELVVQAKFNEWTQTGKLREPTYLGLRNDAVPATVRREPIIRPASRDTDGPRQSSRTRRRYDRLRDIRGEAAALLRQLDALLAHGQKGTLTFLNGTRLDVDGLHKPMWPTLGITKGALMAYYMAMAPYVLPGITDRPLTYRPYPHGAQGRPDRYHQRVKRAVPRGIRVAALKGSQKSYEPRFIGGSLMTLLYLVQFNVISVDAWTSRVATPEHPDVAVLDLDPMPGVAFSQVRDVARWVHETLDQFGIPGFVKTSGSSGLHLYIPLAAGTTFRQAWQFCQVLARLVAQQHPNQATMERSIGQRGRRVYLDYLQNLPGKTLAAAYSVRANAFAGVSAPLRWAELEDDITPQDFTLSTMPERVKQEGDLWADLATAKGVDLRAPVESARHGS